MSKFEESKIRKIHSLAEVKWGGYSIPVCHILQDIINDDGIYHSHNFYEFCKGFVLSHLDQQQIIDQKDTEIEKLRKENKAHLDALKYQGSHSVKLHKENEKLRKCVEFYADEDVMEYLTGENFVMDIKENGRCISQDKGGLARQTLKELSEVEGE